MRAIRYLIWLWPLWLTGAAGLGIGAWLMLMPANPANIRAEVERIRELVANGKADGAMRALDALIADNENANPHRMQTIAAPMADAYRLRARLHLETNGAKRALDDSTNAIRLLPNVPDSHRLYRQARHASEGCPAAPSRLQDAWCLFHSARYAEAGRAFSGLVATAPNDSMAHYGLGISLLLSGNAEAALDPLARAAAFAAEATTHEMRGPHRSRAHAARALALTQLGRNAEAAEAFKEAENAHIFDPASFYIRGRFHEAAGAWDIALDYYSKARNVALDCYVIYFYRARALRALKSRDDANRDSEKSAKLGLQTPGGNCGTPVALDLYPLPEREFVVPVHTAEKQK